VPWNIIDGPSPEAVAWTNGTARYDGLAVQTVIAADLTTSLLDLPAGELGLASGIEYRKEFSDFIPDTLTASNALFATAVPRTRGEFNVKEAYIETVVPLLADVPEAYRMSVEAAVRLADYSSAGTVDQWRLQFTWSLVPEATFRASLASAVRAPDIVESYGPRGSGNTSAALDPCDRAQIIAAASNPNLQATRIANCASVIPGYDPATFQSNAGIGSIPTTTGSNDKLFEERAETLSVGMVFQPRWLDRLKFSIDYWRIELEDAITTVPVNTLLSTLCYDATEPVAGNRFCGAIHRNLNAGEANTGHILRIELINQNAQAINTAGFDVAMSFVQPAGNVGELDFRLDATKTIRWDLIGFPGAAVAQQVGTLTSGIPEYKAQAALGWRRGPLYAQWQTRFQDSYAISSVDPPASRDPFYTGNYYQHDLNANYQWTDNFATRLGILNITNEHPPLLPEVGNATDTNSSATYDNRGRWFYLGFNYSFGAAN
jgi:iron complex outermembrane receptor protein